MEIKEVEAALEEALKKPEDEGLKTKYADAITAYLKEKKSSDEVVSIVVRGIDLDRAANYFDYLDSVNKNDIQSVWKQIRESKVVSENKNNNGLKLVSGLLSQAFMKVGNTESQTGNIVSKLIALIDDEKHLIPDKVYGPIVLDYFVDEALTGGKYPEWDSFKISGANNKRFAEIILTVTECDEEKYKSIRQWASRGIRFAEDLIEKEKIEARIPKSRVSEMFEIVDHYKALEKQVRDDEYKIADLGKEIEGLQKEIDRLNSEKRDLQGEIKALQGDVADQKKNLEKAEQEIDARKSINDAFSAVKKNDEEGMLNDIAGELKTVYGQMKSSESTEMTVQLGEIYREMIKSIFKTLDKKGVKVD